MEIANTSKIKSSCYKITQKSSFSRWKGTCFTERLTLSSEPVCTDTALNWPHKQEMTLMCPVHPTALWVMRATLCLFHFSNQITQRKHLKHTNTSRERERERQNERKTHWRTEKNQSVNIPVQLSSGFQLRSANLDHLEVVLHSVTRDRLLSHTHTHTHTHTGDGSLLQALYYLWTLSRYKAFGKWPQRF